MAPRDGGRCATGTRRRDVGRPGGFKIQVELTVKVRPDSHRQLDMDLEERLCDGDLAWHLGCTFYGSLR
jgi:hypothetical protein